MMDLFWEHSQHEEISGDCSECYKELLDQCDASKSHFNLRNFMNLGIKITLICVAFIGFIFWIGYYSSCRSAKIYNDRYNTAYSCGDFFWAVDQINSQTITIK